MESQEKIEQKIVFLLKDGVFDEADELIEEHGLDWVELYLRAGYGRSMGLLK